MVIRTTNRYQGFWKMPVEGVFYEVQGLRIGKHPGVLRQWSRGSRFVREEFTYRNGQIAYTWTPYRKKFRLYRPNGSLWMEVTAKVRSSWKRMTVFLEKIQATLHCITSDGYIWSDRPDYEIRLYSERGRPFGHGQVSNRQRTGIWKHGKAEYFYLMGVSVSHNVFCAGSDELDPREILKTDNAQLRAALMKKIGPERLLKKLPFAVCDVHGDNQLLKVDVKSILGTEGQAHSPNPLDDQIAIAVLKCTSTGQLYYLRVPPMLSKVEHARQWLCGVDMETVEEEYIRDRWMRLADRETGQLPLSQQNMMRTELEQARHRQRLEFVAEA